MKISALKYRILSWVSGFIMLIFLLLPFHAFLTVWGSSLFGHYTLFRLWKETLLVICVLGVLYLLATDHKIRFHILSRRLVWLMLSYMLLNLAWGLLALNHHNVTAKALGYGLIINLRFLAFFLVTWVVALQAAHLRAYWQWLVLSPAIIVVTFGIIQEFLLTPRFLEHFGYSMYTILPFQYVDNQPGLLRIQSTLRGANPLGAYLVIVICVIAVLLVNKHLTKYKKPLIVFGVASLTALYFTYSRSAWLGSATGLAIIIGSTAGAAIKKGTLIALGLVILLAGGLGLSMRHNSYIESAILHVSPHLKSHITSNGARSSAIKAGLHDLAHHPLGDGPGTAGPASVYNHGHPARIAENYFIQVGQETGWLGLTLFTLINVGVGYLLWLRRDDPLALSLLASLVGLTLINMLSHAWADDTLAYIWWGLAGITMVSDPKPKIKTKTKTVPRPKLPQTLSGRNISMRVAALK